MNRIEFRFTAGRQGMPVADLDDVESAPECEPVERLREINR